MATSSNIVYVQMIRGAESYEIETLGYLARRPLGRIGHGGRFGADRHGEQAPAIGVHLVGQVEIDALRPGGKVSNYAQQPPLCEARRRREHRIDDQQRTEFKVLLAQIGKNRGEARGRVGVAKRRCSEVAQDGIITSEIGVVERAHRRPDELHQHDIIRHGKLALGHRVPGRNQTEQDEDGNK